MFHIHSVTGRIFVGVVTGLTIGVLINVTSPLFGFPRFSMFGWGTLILFVMMGLVIGLVGVFDEHPVFGFKMRWWIRGSVAGFIFSLLFILLGYQSVQTIMQSDIIARIGITSPFWMLADGIIIGLFIAFLETKIAGEGSKLSLQ